MAQRDYLQERFSCCNCLNLLEDPVAFSCGQSYCRKCVKAHWDKKEKKLVHSCPQCRQTFKPSHHQSYLGFGTVTAEGRDQLQDVLSEKFQNVSLTGSDIVLPSPEPRTREDFIRYLCKITLDPNTAHTHLLLSEGNRKATLMREEQAYSSHPDRFIRWRQVLSEESLTGRCYWEVEWKTKRVTVAVAYKNIGREGNITECAFGFSNMSWALECNSSSYKFIQNCVKTRISGPRASRVGVYLDHGAGILSFYTVTETMTLLHRVQTVFTQPLHAGVWFAGYPGAFAEFCELKSEETESV